MFSKIILMLVFLASTSAFAAQEYICEYMGDEPPSPMNLVHISLDSADQITVSLSQLGLSEIYNVDPAYQADSRRMAEYKRFYPADPDTISSSYEPLGTLYIEKALYNGGQSLASGEMGGFIKAEGWGYNLATYRCVAF